MQVTRMTKEEKREYDRAYYLANKQKKLKQVSANYYKNKEQYAAKHKEWREANPEQWLALARKNAAKRRAIVSNFCMSELDLFVFEEAIELAKSREKVVGGKWEIDHIVPLKHKNACGLHVAANFQVVPAEWNRAKNNHNMNEFIIGKDYAGL